MPRLVWSILCQRVLVDMEANDVSVVGILEELPIPSAMNVLPTELQFVTLWDRTPDGPERQVFDWRIRVDFPGTANQPSAYLEIGTHELQLRRLRTLFRVFGLHVGAAKLVHFTNEHRVAGSEEFIAEGAPLELTLNRVSINLQLLR